MGKSRLLYSDLYHEKASPCRVNDQGKLDLYEEDVAKEAFRNFMTFYRTFMGMFYRKESLGSKLLFDTHKEHLEKGYFQGEDKILPISLK